MGSNLIYNFLIISIKNKEKSSFIFLQGISNCIRCLRDFKVLHKFATRIKDPLLNAGLPMYYSTHARPPRPLPPYGW